MPSKRAYLHQVRHSGSNVIGRGTKPLLDASADVLAEAVDLQLQFRVGLIAVNGIPVPRRFNEYD
jgi:hypothetical protein